MAASSFLNIQKINTPWRSLIDLGDFAHFTHFYTSALPGLFRMKTELTDDEVRAALSQG